MPPPISQAPARHWTNAGRSPVDAYWASQPALPLIVRQRAWWAGYVAGVLSSVAAAAIGALAIYSCLG